MLFRSAFVFQPLQFAWWVRPVNPLDVRRAYLRETGVQAEAALLEGSHFLEAQSHVMHCALDQKSIHGVSLEHEAVKESLRLLEQAQSTIILLF